MTAAAWASKGKRKGEKGKRDGNKIKLKYRKIFIF